MHDFRKDMAPISRHDSCLRIIEELGKYPWAIKYIGRRINDKCKQKYPEAESKGFTIQLPWAGQVAHEERGAFDISDYVHELEVEVFTDGPATGRIKKVSAHHWDLHWGTSIFRSDDEVTTPIDKRLPNDEEIRAYEEILDSFTYGGSAEQLNALHDKLAMIALAEKGHVKVRYNAKEVSRTPFRKPIQTYEIEISSDGALRLAVDLPDLSDILDFSHVYIQALFSPMCRKEIGMKHVLLSKDSSSSWAPQIFANLFSTVPTSELYPYMEDSCRAWLSSLFDGSASFRHYMGVDDAEWWRDAWWRLQEVLSSQHKSSENTKLINYMFPKSDHWRLSDIFAQYAGSVKTQEKSFVRDVEPYAKTDFYSGYKNGEKILCEFKTTIINGVEWSYCICSNAAIIDITASKVVKDGIECIVFPSSIAGAEVERIVAIEGFATKTWGKVRIPAVAIGGGVFRGWTNLEEAVFYFAGCECSSNTLVRLGGSAFENCHSLKRIILEDNLVLSETSSKCFKGCQSLERVQGRIIASIGNEAFMGCERLQITDIYLGGLGIGVSAFEDCAMLQNIHLHGNSAKAFSLRRNTFKGCSSLKAVVLPQQVRIIEESAFQNCSSSCFINYEGDDFWFLGADALGNCQCIRWGLICDYEKQEAPLSDLLKTFSIDRDSFLRTLDTICKSRGYYYDYLGAYGG